ncbi:superoxide dismutase family protein [Clostridiaceae bacterium]|nr:superoxide dismutase family protein [Clostridiaceae bacterium]
MQNPTPRLSFIYLLQNTTPRATAWVRGSAEAPELSGLVKFYETPYGGVLVEAEIFGLPNVNIQNSSDFYAMHIHNGSGCQDNFSHINGHFNPANQPHPGHAGDLLPLLGNQGYAWTAFYDKRFNIEEITGKYVIIHAHPDDFTTQPSGNPGSMIACGEIRPA